MSTDRPLQESVPAAQKCADPQPEKFYLHRPLLAVAALVLVILLVLLHSYPPWPGDWPTDTAAQYFVDAAQAADGRIDLNTADAAALQALPGIGAGRADAILAYRAAHGPFTAVDQLLLVEGIGEKTLEELRAYITVLPAPAQKE